MIDIDEEYRLGKIFISIEEIGGWGCGSESGPLMSEKHLLMPDTD